MLQFIEAASQHARQAEHGCGARQLATGGRYCRKVLAAVQLSPLCGSIIIAPISKPHPYQASSCRHQNVLEAGDR